MIGAQVYTITLITTFAHWLFLWLAFYFFSRRPRARATTLAAASMLCVAGYMVGNALSDAAATRAEAVMWARIFGMLSALAPMLLLHAEMELTGARFRYRRVFLAAGYAVAGAIIALGLSSKLLFDYYGPARVVADMAWAYPLGPLYPVYGIYLVLSLGLAVGVLASARWRAARPPQSVAHQLTWLIVGTATMLVGVALLTLNALSGWIVREAYLQPFLVVGALVIAYAIARYPGLVAGQLLWNDLKASLFGAALLMAGLTAILLAVDASRYVFEATGWFVLAAFVFNREHRTLADLPFFGPKARTDRADLLMASQLAGGAPYLDTSALAQDGAGGLLEYVSDVERAGMAWERLRFEHSLWMDLLGRDEYANVRRALGMQDDWSPRQPFPVHAVRISVEQRLKSRERLAIGLKYLGYSDREMASLMDVKPNVPRSYLSEAKGKLDLPAGAPLMLFAHFSGVVTIDALPVVGSRTGPRYAVESETLD